MTLGSAQGTEPRLTRIACRSAPADDPAAAGHQHEQDFSASEPSAARKLQKTQGLSAKWLGQERGRMWAPIGGHSWKPFDNLTCWQRPASRLFGPLVLHSDR